MLKKISTSRSATFYRKKSKFSKTFIENLFTQVSQKKIGHYTSKVIQEKTSRPFLSEISFLVFKFEDEPSFLTNSGLKEQKYAFVMLVEFGEFLAVLKKNISGLEKLIEERCSRLEYDEIYGLFSDEDPAYEKMSLSNMGISKAAILRRTLESSDLKGQLSSQSSRRSIANTATVKTKDHRHVLRPQSSSVSKTDSKSNFPELLQWLNQIWDELKKGVRTNKFLDGFAQPVKFESIKGKIRPVGLLLNLNEIKNYLESDGSLLLNGKVLSDDGMDRVLTWLDGTFEIREENEKFKIYLDKYKKAVGELKVNEKSLTLQSNWLKMLEVAHPDIGQIDLQRLINAEQEFIVTYHTPEFIYKSKRVFRDKGIVGHCDEIEASLMSMDFAGVISEKGEVTRASVKFAGDSLFNSLENKVEEASLLICDDLGDEWADYIELTKEKVCLYHCKVGDPSTSASQLHEVVAQALKNIGRTSFTQEQISNKLASWNANYATSRIKRIRSNHNLNDIIPLAAEFIKNPFSTREIVLVVPFLSKVELGNAFVKLRDQLTVKPHIPQLVWLLSTFVASCKEAGVQAVIYCSE